MQKSNAPAIITVPFASSAGPTYRNTIPIPSQIPITPGAASWTDGFPPLTMTQTGAGGIPPYGQDMNGLGFALSTINQWTQLGFVSAYSSSVSTAIGGYPQGACLGQLGGLGYWLSVADNNTTNPDTTGATNWVAVRANAGRSTISVAAGTVTPDPSVLGAPLLVLSGTLTANVTLVLPLTQPGAGWAIYNATTGAFTVNVQGATGSGVVASQGSLTDVRTDGTNFYTGSLSGGPFLPLHGTADAATKLATARTIAMTGDVSWTSAAFDGTGNVTGTSTIAAAAVTLAKMANLAANTLIGNPTGTAATPTAIALANGLQFSGGNLGMGTITPAAVTSSGTIQGAQISATGNSTAANFVGSTANAILAGSGGSVFLRPLGLGSASAQSVVDSTGLLTVAAGVTSNGVNTINVGAVGSGQFSQNYAFNLTGTDTNTDRLLVGLYRGTAGSSWINASWRFQRQVDSTLLSYIQFGTGDGSGNDGIQMGGGTTSVSIISSGTTFSTQVNAPTFNITSDERLKDDIANFAPRDLTVDNPWIAYTLRDSGVRSVGLSAQRTRTNGPEHVNDRGDGFFGMDYGKAAAEQAWYLTECMKSMRAELDALKARIH